MLNILEIIGMIGGLIFATCLLIAILLGCVAFWGRNEEVEESKWLHYEGRIGGDAYEPN